MRVPPRIQIMTRVLVTVLFVSSFMASRNRLFLLIPSESPPSSSLSAMAHPRAERKISAPPCNSTALRQLGKHGRWVQDWNFVRQYGYTRGDVVQSGPLIKGTHGQFRPSPDAPFPWPSSWRWVGREPEWQHVTADMAMNGALTTNYNNNGRDNNRLFYPVDPMTPRNMCHLLVNQLNVRKIAFYGDSLTMQQADSFLNLFGSSYIETLSSFSSKSPSSPLFSMEQVKYSLNCPQSPAMESLHHSRHTAKSIHTTNAKYNSTTHSTISIPIFMQKESGGQAFPHSPRTDFEFSMEFHYFLTVNPSPIVSEEEAVEENNNHETQSQNQIRHHHKSLVIFNIGAHYHNTTWYEQDMLKLLGLLKDVGHPDDLYFFRTNVPGHVHCQPTSPQTFDWKRGTREIPHRDLDEFRNSLEKKGGGGGHDWEKFPMWNEISKDMIRQFNNVDKGVERDGLWMGQTAELSSGTMLSPSSLPIVMHVLDVFDMTALRRDGHNALKGDCLHYVLPGPPDWWNHLLYSYLRELSGVLRGGGFVNCRP
mmetsp:Transcript_10982/g.20656  ORF Transcript_10982/g.20656 Transcript_10982/m.20656 type:complete len:535 (-) Transcript_10982:32-1636(-)